MKRIPRGTLKWCQKNGWKEPFLVEGKYWAYPPGGYIPLPLPVQPFSKFAKDFAVVLLFACILTALVWLGWMIFSVFLDALGAVIKVFGPTGINILWVFSLAFMIPTLIGLSISMLPAPSKAEKLSMLGVCLLSSFVGVVLPASVLLSSDVGAGKLIVPAIYNAVFFGIVLYRIFELMCGSLPTQGQNNRER